MARCTVYIWGETGQYENYRRAVAAAGGQAVVTREFAQAERCDGLLLPGGGDLEPWRYGQVNTASRGLEPERDTAELALLARFTETRRPVLGICRGMQTINVFFGGTLVQNLPGHGAVEGIDRLHTIRAAGGTFGALWGARVIVNSAHHQAVERLGRGLRAAQWAADGTVEALCHHRLPLWAVQWHPERLRGRYALAGAAEGDALFRAFVVGCGG